MNIKDYIQGKRHGKEANRLEREAMNDPFLQDAIEGFDSVPDNHLPVIEELENRIQKKSTKKTTRYRIWIFSAAASLVLLLGITTLMRKDKLPENDLVHQTTQPASQAKQQLIEGGKSILDTLEIVENKKNMAQNIQKVKPESTRYKKIEAIEAIEEIEELVDNTEPVALNVKAIELKPIEMEMDTEKQITEPVHVQIRGTASVQKVLAEKVSGIVLDETGQPVIGANVKFKNNFNKTITDMNGRFELPMMHQDKTDQLVTSFIGYESKEISVPGDSAIIRLKPDNLALNEVVVVGYGKRRKSPTFDKVKVKETFSGQVAGLDVNNKSIIKNFSEKEFKKYFDQNRKQNICDNERGILMAGFYIDDAGKPTKTEIINCNCKELEEEFLRLVNTSPVWTKTNRNVIITIRLK